MVQLTKMQQRIYDYIAQTIRTQGYPPSVREIGDAVGLKSPSTVHRGLPDLRRRRRQQPVFCPPGSGGVHAQRRHSAGRSGGGAPAADR